MATMQNVIGQGLITATSALNDASNKSLKFTIFASCGFSKLPGDHLAPDISLFNLKQKQAVSTTYGLRFHFPFSDRLSVVTGLGIYRFRQLEYHSYETSNIQVNDIRPNRANVSYSFTYEAVYTGIPIQLEYKHKRVAFIGGMRFMFNQNKRKDYQIEIVDLEESITILKKGNRSEIPVRRFNFGITTGIRLELYKSLGLEAGYFFGLSNIIDDAPWYKLSTNSEQITLGLCYEFDFEKTK